MRNADSEPLPSFLWPITDDAVKAVMADLITDGSWGRYLGPHCEALRTALADQHGVEHAVLTCSGTAAMELALRAVQVQPGDEVIMAAYDFKANFINVTLLGATPVLVDTLPGRPVISADQIAHAVTHRTKAIICSHLHGTFAPVADIMAIAADAGQRHGQKISVIEDACQASGAILHGQPAATHGDVGILSFGGSKLLTAGRGGAVLTRNAQAAQRIRLWTERGNSAYPLSEMQAALLMAQLPGLHERTLRRRDSVRHLQSLINSDSLLGLVSDDSCGQLPESLDSETIPAFYKLAVLLKSDLETPKVIEAARNAICEQLKAFGVAIDPALRALHLTHARSRFRAIGDLPHATDLHRRLMTIHHPILLQNAEILNRLATFLNRAGP
ncbi:MAG: aminotransferase class V-fold PLP-dependent enzyme [Planctomycetaceae bacterium]